MSDWGGAAQRGRWSPDYLDSGLEGGGLEAEESRVAGRAADTSDGQLQQGHFLRKRQEILHGRSFRE